MPKTLVPSSRPEPEGWGVDRLTQSWNGARENQFAVFANKRAFHDLLALVEDAFFSISNNMTNPKDQLAALLLHRCHSAFIASSGLAAAGQVTESYVMNRSVLECAAYALHINRHPGLDLVWLNRHRSEADEDACRAGFLHKQVKDTVKKANQHAGERFEQMYDSAIDFGGHPNERSVMGSLQMTNEPGRKLFKSIFQHDDSPALALALKSTIECGLCALEILECVFGSRFELVGTKEKMLTARTKLGALTSDFRQDRLRRAMSSPEVP